MALQKIVTPEECCKILEKDLQTKNFEMIKYEEKSLAEEVLGIMAGHYKLSIQVKMNDATITKQYFVKRMISRYEIQNKMIKMQGAYEKEKFVYDFLTELSEMEPKYSTNFIPKCFLTVKDDKFVLEDLNQQGYVANKSGNFTVDVPHFKMALQTLARFHASSLIYENKKSQQKGGKYKMTDEFSQYFKDSIYRQEKDYLGNNIHKASTNALIALIDVVQIYSENEKEELKRKVQQEFDKAYEYVKASKKYHNVLCHGDLWCNNMLFKYDKDDVIDCQLIDFQAIRYTIPAHDFLILLHVSNSTDFINTHQQELQEYYYISLKTCLEKCGIDINKYIPYEEFLESMEYILPFIIMQKAEYVSMYAMAFDESLMKDGEKFKTFLYEDRIDKCVDLYEKNEIFREATHDAYRNLKLL